MWTTSKNLAVDKFYKIIIEIWKNTECCHPLWAIYPRMWQGPPGVDNAQIRGTGVGFTYPLDRWTRGEEGLNIQSPRCCECDIPSSHTPQACQSLFFGILEQIANAISCYFLLWGDKGCWKFKLVPSIRLCCPKAGLEKTQHHKKLPHCQGLGNYLQKWI